MSRTLFSERSWTLATALILVAWLGTVALLRAQSSDGPLQRLFGAPAKKQAIPAPLAQPPLREDTYRLVEILVELSWLSDPFTFPYYIEARVVGPNLEVRGNVPSRAVREHAVKLAGLNSPMNVVDKLKENPHLVFRPLRMNPDQLEKVAVSGLKEALPRQYKGLQPRGSADGRVAVVGKVDSFEEKLIVSQTIRRLHGATMVTNLVQVASDPDGSVARSLARSLPPTTVAAAPTTSDDPGDPASTTFTGPPAGDVPLPPVPGNATVTVGSSPIVAAADANTPASMPIRKDLPSLAHLKKVLEKACPGAREIKLIPTPSGELRVEVYARATGDTKLVDQIFAVHELVDNFQFRLSLHYPEQ